MKNLQCFAKAQHKSFSYKICFSSIKISYMIINYIIAVTLRVLE